MIGDSSVTTTKPAERQEFSSASQMALRRGKRPVAKWIGPFMLELV